MLKTRKTGVRESGVGSFKNWSKLFTNLKSYGPKATVKVMRNSALEQEVESWLAEGSASD